MFMKFSWKYALGLIVGLIGLVFVLTNPSKEDYIKYETKRFVAAIDENNLGSIKCSADKVEFQGKTYLIEFSLYGSLGDEWTINSSANQQVFQDICVETLLYFKQNQNELTNKLEKFSNREDRFFFSYYNVNYNYIKDLIYLKLKERYPKYITPDQPRYSSDGHLLAGNLSSNNNVRTEIILQCPDITATGILGQIKWCSDGSSTSLIKIRFF